MSEEIKAARDFPESKLYAPVKAWLESQGYRVFPECWGHDVVAYRDSRIVTVELKMSLTRTLYFQLIRAAVFSDAVYGAVPGRPRASSLSMFTQYKFGVLRVVEPVEVLVEAQENQAARWRDSHEKVLQILQGWTPLDEVAGLPTLKGSGPAQKCAERVRKYLREKPSAGWREIYRDVPNHYAHHRSMRGAMPPLDYLKPIPLTEPGATNGG